MPARSPEDERAYAQREAELDARLRPQLTAAFLATLVDAARTVGWRTDYHEVAAFVEHCFELAGQPRPAIEALEPYQSL